jgi:hypothetical protein
VNALAVTSTQDTPRRRVAKLQTGGALAASPQQRGKARLLKVVIASVEGVRKDGAHFFGAPWA